MKWKLEIETEELLMQLSNILFSTIIPENINKFDVEIQDAVSFGSITYTATEIIDHSDLVKIEILSNENLDLITIKDSTFENYSLIKVTPENLPMDILIIYDKDTYIAIYQVDNKIFRFNLGFYLMLLQIESLGQAFDQLESLLAEQLLANATDESEDDFFTEQSTDEFIS